ncbi:hypothetical protein SLH49_03730 [Cognatiyoonia sp. IB215446]|uniref:hypothetical protein n=1 Tax=Cognatiyoonia sp. IB215446 TaxID=3097355 RepID=UPI002A1780C6|nr:hypothetical protein [Cognatiyoonia sp. IB215446]MDX8347088.1 hypothetical protein [Cognatiyoonia sp. IB215446]
MMLRTICTCLFASTAIADCPTGADRATGIRATLSDGSVEEYRDLSPGLVELIARYEDGYTARNILGQGVYVVELSDLEDGQIVPTSRITSAYPMSAEKMPIPKPDTDWQVKVAMRDSDGFFQEEQTHRWGALTKVTYTDCTYDMIPGELTYQGDGYSYFEEIHYLPALGLGLLVSYATDDGAPPDVFDYTEFAVMGDE